MKTKTLALVAAWPCSWASPSNGKLYRWVPACIKLPTGQGGKRQMIAGLKTPNPDLLAFHHKFA
jgi:hypothetical protein